MVAIFGANGSGKSNLLDALRWMQAAVCDSFGSWRATADVPRLPFLLNPAAAARPSRFATELLIDGVRHMYGFIVDDQRVIEEWLYSYPQNRKRVVFERDDTGWSFGISIPRAKSDVLRKLTRDNTLFLSVAGHSDVEATKPAYQWFERSPLVTSPHLEFDEAAVARYLRGSERQRRLVVELVRAADLGIRDIRLKDDAASDPLRRSTGPELLFHHMDHDVVLTVADESHGTLSWLRLVVPTLIALDRGLVLCVDEIDASLHPTLTPRLIELFRSTETNPRGAQLIFTTHDATLLGTSFGEDILARDEVWFIEKSADGATTLFPLSDFKPRKEENTERRYLGGTYGAVPNVSEYEFRRTITDIAEAA